MAWGLQIWFQIVNRPQIDEMRKLNYFGVELILKSVKIKSLQIVFHVPPKERHIKVYLVDILCRNI